MVLEKSRPTFHYRFAVMMKNVIFRQIKTMLLEKSRSTYYRFIVIGAVHMSRASPANRADSILSRPVMA